MLGLKFFKLLGKTPFLNSITFSYAAKQKPPTQTSGEDSSKESKAHVKPAKKLSTDSKPPGKDLKPSKHEKNKSEETEEKMEAEKYELNKTSEITLDRLRKMKQKFSITKDQFRVDVGLIIDRPPIFLHLSEQEMQFLKYRNTLEKKYKVIPSVPKELIEYSFDKQPGRLSQIPENKQTHLLELEDGTEDYYCENSKVFFEVDPSVTHPKSIQRVGNYRVYLLVKNKESNEWEFPSFNVLESEKFNDATVKFFRFLSNDVWKIYYYPVEPFALKAREFTEEEKKDPRNKKLQGVKIFYFGASHQEGIVEINEKLYSDFVWTTKLEMNQYLTRENYKTFIHSLALY